MRTHALAIGLLGAALLAACGGSAPSTPSAQATTPPPAATGKGACAAVHAGETGVIATYCSGTAVFKVTVGSVSKEIDGGSCQTSAGLFVALGGVATDHTFVGARPDFVSVNTPPTGGGGQDTGASITLNDHFYGDSGRFGGTTTFAADHKSLHFDGTSFAGDTATIDLTC
jgi:hypothetical protein